MTETSEQQQQRKKGGNFRRAAMWAGRAAGIKIVAFSMLAIVILFTAAMLVVAAAGASDYGRCSPGGEWRTNVETDYPQAAPYLDTIGEAATEHGLDAALLAALIAHESRFDPNAVSPAGARGIAQFMPGTAAGLGLDPTDPTASIHAAAEYLAGHIADFGSTEMGLAAYNAGAGNVRRYGGVPPFAETRNYVQTIPEKAAAWGSVDPGVCQPAPGELSEPTGNIVDLSDHGIFNGVDESIADNVKALMAHARRDGLNLTGTGWRSPQRTAELRVTNGCPDVYTAPSSSCRVPTAIPGTSEHEKGLAIDFSNNGQLIRSHSTRAAQWLAANGPTYGLYVLTSGAEPWHLSTTSR